MTRPAIEPVTYGIHAVRVLLIRSPRLRMVAATRAPLPC